MRDESKLPTVLRRKLPPNLEKIKYGHYTKDDLDYPIHLYLKENDIRVQEEGSEIVEFLRGKHILVTGATGFLGKLLVEKLLRCCKDIGMIYIIVRSKKGKDTQTRVSEYLDNWVFYKLSEIYPDYKEKVYGINGDFEEDGIGLTEESRCLIKDKVNIVFHVAATIRFDEKLKKAVKINIKGTQEIIRLAKECNKMDAFVHVSTAFSNCHEKVINEVFYTPHLDPYKLMAITEALPDEVVDRIAPDILGEVPNTYAFTKQVAEDLVRQEAAGIPSCIFRPSIVIASAREPVRSWVDNIFGPVGLIEGSAIGLVHTMLGKRHGKCDMVPADYVINSCIATAYKVGKDRRVDKTQIFNYTSSKENPLFWNNLWLSADQGEKVGSTLLITKGFFNFTVCNYWFAILHLFLHKLPGHIADFVAVQLGKKPQLVAAYNKIEKFINVLSHFTLNEWTFDSSHTRELWNSLNEVDKTNFPFDIRSLDWANYFDTYLVAMREFLAFEFLDNLDEGRWHQRKVTIIRNTFVAVVASLSIYFLGNTSFFFIPLFIVSIIIYYSLSYS